MRLNNPFKFISHSLSDVWTMHDFNYQLPQDKFSGYWDEECIKHPTNSHCKIYE